MAAKRSAFRDSGGMRGMITAAAMPLAITAPYSARKCSPTPAKSATTLANATDTTEKLSAMTSASLSV